MLAFLIGGSYPDSVLVYDCLYLLIFGLGEGLMQYAAYYLLKKGVIKYYRWREQEWWEDNKKDTPVWSWNIGDKVYEDVVTDF